MADIYNSKNAKDAVFQKIQEKSNYSEDELEALEDWKLWLEEQGLATKRVQRYLQTFNRLDEEIDFNIVDPEKVEVRKLLAKIQNDLVKENGEDYSPWTINEFIKGLKKFYLFHKEQDSEFFDEIEFNLNVSKSDRPLQSSDDLPGPSEVKEMVKTADTMRNALLVFFLWDTGARIGEALNVKWKDVRFDGRGAKIKIRKSKSQPREIPVYECVQHLKNWRENTPSSDNADYVFVNNSNRGGNSSVKGDQLKYASARKAVKKAARRLDEDYSPHDFRRGRATYLASQGWNAPTLCEFFGWSAFSTAETYIQLAAKDTENAMAKLKGFEDADDEEEKSVRLRPLECKECGKVNPATRDYCEACGELITIDEDLQEEVKANSEQLKSDREKMMDHVENILEEKDILEQLKGDIE